MEPEDAVGAGEAGVMLEDGAGDERFAQARRRRHGAPDEPVAHRDDRVALEVVIRDRREEEEGVDRARDLGVRLLDPLDEGRREALGRKGGEALRDGRAEPERRVEVREDERPPVGVREDLLEEVANLEDLREEPEDLAEPPVLLPGPGAVEDVVEEEVLHHRGGHPVDLATGLVDDDGPESTDFGVDGDRHGGTPVAAAGEYQAETTMSEEVDFIICNNCETPCYQFELDRKGNVASAFCTLCGNDDAKEFRLPEVEDIEDQG